MTANDIVKKIKSLAECKTIYVKGAPCVAMNQRAKLKYTGSNPFNAKRSTLIFAASEDTIGLDEITLINFVVEEGNFKNVGEIMEKCHDISKDFTHIVPGELVFSSNLVGVYVGDGKAITCTGVGIHETPIEDWVSHGKMMFVDYVDSELISLVAEAVEEEKEDVKPVESDVEVRPSGAGSGDRMYKMPSQAKGYDRGHGRRKS